MIEKQLLGKLQPFNFVIDLKQALIDEEHLYFIFEFCFGTIAKLIEI